MKYCDFSFGPLLIRQNSPIFNDFFAGFTKSSSNLAVLSIDVYLMNPNTRTILCSDCMFYANTKPFLDKETLIPMAQKYMLNTIQIEQDKFEFTCPDRVKKTSVFKIYFDKMLNIFEKIL